MLTISEFSFDSIVHVYILFYFSDVDECLDGNGDCEHECINEIGSYRCACKSGYKLRMDNRTCELELNNITTSNAGDDINQTAAAHMKRCYASCESLVRLHEKMKILQEKVFSKIYLNSIQF